MNHLLLVGAASNQQKMQLDCSEEIIICKDVSRRNDPLLNAQTLQKLTDLFRHPDAKARQQSKDGTVHRLCWRVSM